MGWAKAKDGFKKVLALPKVWDAIWRQIDGGPNRRRGSNSLALWGLCCLGRNPRACGTIASQKKERGDAMPPTRREYLKRRSRQADVSLKRAQAYLATVHATVRVQHPELCPVLLAIIGQIDGIRRAILLYHRVAFGGTERDLWKSADMDIILERAETVPDPHYR